MQISAALSAAMDQDSFLFIEETGNGPQEPRTRSKIKMHVMDRVVDRKRRMTTRQKAPSHIEDRRQNADSRARRRNRRLQNETIPFLLPSVHQSYGSDSGSIIGTQNMLRLSGLDVKMNNHSKFLLHHFLNFRPKTLCTVSVETGWIDYALKDAGLFHCTLYHWALLNYDLLPSNFRTQPNLLQMKGAAMSMINERLRAVNGQNISDEIIASVACLSSVNLLLGDVEEAKIHFHALDSMITYRKGIHNLGYDGLIARLVKWADACHSQITGTGLCFEEHDVCFEPNISAPFSKDLKKSSFAESKEVRRIHSMSTELMLTPRETLSNDGRVSFGQRFLASDRELLIKIHRESLDRPSVSSITATAALIYSNTILRGISRSSRVLKALVSQLKESTCSALTLQDDIFADDPAALVWVLLVGVLAAGEENPEGAWFMWALRRGFGAQSVLKWADVQNMANAPNNFPEPFNWIFSEEVLKLTSVNTRILN